MKKVEVMKQVEVTQYIADDGTVFDTEEECVNYENTLNFNVDELYNAAETIKKYCVSQKICKYCKFFNLGCIIGTTPVDWDI